MSIVTIKNICIYQKNDSITRHDLLLQNMDNYKHVDIESKCVFCDICLKTCACALCNENNSYFSKNHPPFINYVKLISLTLSTRMPYWTSWPDNGDAVAVPLDKMIINA